MIVLVDMDGVLADFEKGYLDAWKRQHPDKPAIQPEDRNTFYIVNQYPKDLRPLVWDILLAPGFFAALEPVEGAIAAVHEMDALGPEVFICSSPLIPNKTGASEKYAWVQQHLGVDWARRLILTSDKTLVHGDYLIDDRPEVDGSQTPTWTHILFDRPYNRANGQLQRLTWSNWKDILLKD